MSYNFHQYPGMSPPNQGNYTSHQYPWVHPYNQWFLGAPLGQHPQIQFLNRTVSELEESHSSLLTQIENQDAELCNAQARLSKSASKITNLTKIVAKQDAILKSIVRALRRNVVALRRSRATELDTQNRLKKLESSIKALRENSNKPGNPAVNNDGTMIDSNTGVKTE